jgi:hypothetical protein
MVNGTSYVLQSDFHDKCWVWVIKQWGSVPSSPKSGGLGPLVSGVNLVWKKWESTLGNGMAQSAPPHKLDQNFGVQTKISGVVTSQSPRIDAYALVPPKVSLMPTRNSHILPLVHNCTEQEVKVTRLWRTSRAVHVVNFVGLNSHVFLTFMNFHSLLSPGT